MPQLALLVIDGTPRTARRTAHLEAVGGGGAAQVLLETLDRLCPQAVLTVLRAGDGQELPAGLALNSFNGILWTGTDLSVCETPDSPLIAQHVTLMRACAQAGVPVFGSGWGLHLAVVALGGEVTRNPLRREFPLARKIQLTQCGVTHPVFAGRAQAYDALALHADVIEALPLGSLILACNRTGGVQAVEIPLPGGSTFCGVQYLPEFDLREMASYATLHQDDLIDEGLFADPGQVAAFSRRAIECQVSERADLLVALGLDDDILRDDIRQQDLAGWLAMIHR